MSAKRENNRAVTRLDRLIDEVIRRHRLLEEGDAVLVGVSGGPDSVALLQALVDRSAALRLDLAVAHLNHGLRPEADQEAEFVAQLAQRWGLPFFLEKADVRAYRMRHHLSLEDAGRRLRLSFFRRLLERHGYEKIALGHQRDDQAETLLMRLLRGSGQLGLAGIPAAAAGRIIRPLLQASRAQITAYLDARGLSAVEDRSNTDKAFLRNRIRSRLIPELERHYQPGIRRVLGRTADILRAEDEWLEALLASHYEKLITRCGDGRIGLDAPALAGLADAAVRRLIRRALSEVKGDLQRIGFAHVEAVVTLARRGSDAGPLHLPGGLRVKRLGPRLVLWKALAGRPARPAEALPDYAYMLADYGVFFIEETGDAVRISELCVDRPPVFGPTERLTAYLDPASVTFPLEVRNFRAGDRFCPLGTTGSQKLKKYFIDHKVPRSERRRCPILLCGSRILWVGGHRLDRRAAWTGQDPRVVKAEVLLANTGGVITFSNGERGL
jgi:tRNA(Ile)-lysidine synthase